MSGHLRALVTEAVRTATEPELKRVLDILRPEAQPSWTDPADPVKARGHRQKRRAWFRARGYPV